jgi:hypothetical protein
MAASKGEQLSNRERDALRIFDDTPKGEPWAERIAKVAQRMGGISTGRTADYVRQALQKSGREGETPRRGGGGGRKPKGPVVVAASERVNALLAEYDQVIEQMTERLAEAKDAAAKFDPDAWRAAEAERLDQAAKDARARAQAFAKNTDGVADQAVESERERLNARAEQVEEETAEQVEKAKAERQTMAEMIERMAQVTS